MLKVSISLGIQPSDIDLFETIALSNNEPIVTAEPMKTEPMAISSPNIPVNQGEPNASNPGNIIGQPDSSTTTTIEAPSTGTTTIEAQSGTDKSSAGSSVNSVLTQFTALSLMLATL